jgi:hypothetical protein
MEDIRLFVAIFLPCTISKRFLEDAYSDNDDVRRIECCLLKSMDRYIDEENERMRMIRVSLFE